MLIAMIFKITFGQFMNLLVKNKIDVYDLKHCPSEFSKFDHWLIY